MGVVGVTLIVGAVLYAIVRPQSVLQYFQYLWRGAQHVQAQVPPRLPSATNESASEGGQGATKTKSRHSASDDVPSTRPLEAGPDSAAPGITIGPPPSLVTIAPPDKHEEEEQATPKAAATTRADDVPTFSLTPSDNGAAPAPAPAPSAAAIARAASAPGSMAPSPRPGLMAPPPRPAGLVAPPPRPTGLMGPPPLPPTQTGLMPPPHARPPTLSDPSSSSQSPLSRSTLPIPNRGPPPSSSSSLAPPPTSTTKPSPSRSASRLATLEPGHSPMDWARISGPTADLRGLPPSTPYLRVTPSMLKKQNGRKGTDAWSAFGGRVYNITPYIPFHPGGKGELFRGAGKDATKLFAEIHPWVNYETMLAACLVGILVDEEDGEVKRKGVAHGHGGGGGSSIAGERVSEMEEMD